MKFNYVCFDITMLKWSDTYSYTSSEWLWSILALVSAVCILFAWYFEILTKWLQERDLPQFLIDWKRHFWLYTNWAWLIIFLRVRYKNVALSMNGSNKPYSHQGAETFRLLRIRAPYFVPFVSKPRWLCLVSCIQSCWVQVECKINSGVSKSSQSFRIQFNVLSIFIHANFTQR